MTLAHHGQPSQALDTEPPLALVIRTADDQYAARNTRACNWRSISLHFCPLRFRAQEANATFKTRKISRERE
jgi:hypothetical protein